MRILVFGAGPLGSLYAHRLIQAGKDVTILARGQRYDRIQANGLALVDEMTGAKEESSAQVVDELRPEDEYDLVIVLIRKNKLPPVFKVLAANARVKSILFMGNNALGFESYLDALPEAKLLFGFPSAGGGVSEHVVHYADVLADSLGYGFSSAGVPVFRCMRETWHLILLCYVVFTVKKQLSICFNHYKNNDPAGGCQSGSK